MSTPGAQPQRRRQQVARMMRRIPGFQPGVKYVLPAIRRNPTLTDLAFRVFLPEHGAGTLPVPLHSGRYLQGRDLAFVPVVGIVAIGLSEEQIDRLLDEVAALQRTARSFRPLLVLDRPAFAAARRHGYVVEVVVPQEHWENHPQGAAVGDPEWVEWPDYLGERLAEIVDRYQLWHLVRAGRQGLDPIDLALLTSLARRLPDEMDVRLLDGDPPPHN